MTAQRRVAVVGGGWAGLAAAVRAVTEGHHVTVFEASRHWGGRARTVQLTLPADGPGPHRAGDSLTLDNGQHILIGAYTDTLRCMQWVGVDLDRCLLRTPLRLTYPDGSGLALPDWPAPFDVLAGLVGAKGWSWPDKWALLRTALGWQLGGFRCTPTATVADLCAPLPQRLRQQFIEPLCISALNTPTHRASGQVFLRVLQDALFGAPKGSNLLLPKVPLGALWPEPAAHWLAQRPHSADLRLGCRVTSLEPVSLPTHQNPHQNPSLNPTLNPTNSTHPTPPMRPRSAWRVNGEVFDSVVWANIESNSHLSLIRQTQAAINTDKSSPSTPMAFESIATVYAWAVPDPSHPTLLSNPAVDGHTLPHPMLALRDSAQHPAQFVFDRGQLGGPMGLLAFVISSSQGDANSLAQAVQAQALAQLGLVVQPMRTLVDKRATFACTPNLQRPAMAAAPGLVLAGDHVQGPYPATLEGAIRSGWAAGAMV